MAGFSLALWRLAAGQGWPAQPGHWLLVLAGLHVLLLLSCHGAYWASRQSYFEAHASLAGEGLAYHPIDLFLARERPV